MPHKHIKSPPAQSVPLHKSQLQCLSFVRVGWCYPTRRCRIVWPWWSLLRRPRTIQRIGCWADLRSRRKLFWLCSPLKRALGLCGLALQKYQQRCWDLSRQWPGSQCSWELFPFPCQLPVSITFFHSPTQKVYLSVDKWWVWSSRRHFQQQNYTPPQKWSDLQRRRNRPFDIDKVRQRRTQCTR